MFTLLKIIAGLGYYETLGKSFHLVERDVNYEEFEKAFKSFFDKEHVADKDPESDAHTTNCYAFVVFNNGASMIPLYKGQKSYVMVETGQTFKNLSYK